MKRRTPRGLDPEERDLWERVAQTASPLDPKKKMLMSPSAETASAKPQIGTTDPLPHFEVGSRGTTDFPSHDLAASIADQVNGSPVAMDKKAFRKLKRGQSKPEARLDLHGMTVAAAHDALRWFIFSAHASGKRLVLVITGKGRASSEVDVMPTRVGVLRHQVPQWLSIPPLSPLVLQVTQAHQRHGGGGALYVYLRRT